MAVAEEAKLRPKIKSTAKDNKTISAMYLVESQILSQGPLDYIPNPTTLARMVMRRRQKERPNDPKTLACSSLMEYLNIDTSFKVADISMEYGNGAVEYNTTIRPPPPKMDPPQKMIFFEVSDDFKGGKKFFFFSEKNFWT